MCLFDLSTLEEDEAALSVKNSESSVVRYDLSLHTLVSNPDNPPEGRGGLVNIVQLYNLQGISAAQSDWLLWHLYWASLPQTLSFIHDTFTVLL